MENPRAPQHHARTTTGQTKMATVPHLYAWDDIKDWPESAGRTEIVDGDLVISPTPSGPHQQICTRLGATIGLFNNDDKLAQFYSCPLHTILDTHVHYEPDLCFVLHELNRWGKWCPGSV